MTSLYKATDKPMSYHNSEHVYEPRLEAVSDNGYNVHPVDEQVYEPKHH